MQWFKREQRDQRGIGFWVIFFLVGAVASGVVYLGLVALGEGRAAIMNAAG